MSLIFNNLNVIMGKKEKENPKICPLCTFLFFPVSKAALVQTSGSQPLPFLYLSETRNAEEGKEKISSRFSTRARHKNVVLPG